MPRPQQAILKPLPKCAKYCFFRFVGQQDLVIGKLNTIVGDELVVGIGLSLAKQLGLNVPGLKPAPDFSWQGIDIPQTPNALCIWVGGADAGVVALRVFDIVSDLAGVFELECEVDAFLHLEGRDVTGYEDGTENPVGEKANQVALVQEGTFVGSSFMAVQQWLHDMKRFQGLSETQQNAVIGRDKVTNKELSDAPESAHVKRTEQESFTPPQFLLRRSMAWQQAEKMGLVFVAFGHSFDAFEAQMRKMTGSQDGVKDALFSISRPLTSAYYWCPAVDNNKLILGETDAC